MLSYAKKLTTSPEAMTVDDINQLKDHGFADTAILEINLVSAYMNFVNRIALGLGVDLEPSKEVFTR